MWVIIQVQLVLTIVAGTFCQNIYLINYQVISPCKNNKTRAEKDVYTMTAHAVGDFADLIAKGWSRFIILEMYQYASDKFVEICKIEMNEALCKDSVPCSCKREPNKHIISLILLLRAFHSKGIIRAKWDSEHWDPTYSDTNYTLPEVYDINSARLSSSLIDLSDNMYTPRCTFQVTVYKSETYKVCCEHIIQPCYVQVKFNKRLIDTDKTPCITYSPPANVTGEVTILFSLCTTTKSDYVEVVNCSQPIDVSTAVATTTDIVADNFTDLTTDISTNLTTDLTTGFTTNVAKRSNLEVIFWIILAVCLLIVSFLVLWMIPRTLTPDAGLNIHEGQEGIPAPTDVPAPTSEEVVSVCEVDVFVSEEVVSVSEVDVFVSEEVVSVSEVDVSEINRYEDILVGSELDVD